MAILYTIIIFGLIIFIHELGHFIVAKLCKVTVKEFSLGMGPALIKFKPKETLYALRLFPIGGYVAMEGEMDASEDENSFSKKSVSKRIAICVAGAVMNLILGFSIIAFSLIGVKHYNSTTVAQFKADASTSQTGLAVGDKIVKINKTAIFTDKDIVFEIMRDTDGLVNMQVMRNGEKVKLPEVKFTVSGEGETKKIYLDFMVKAQDPSFFGGVGRAFKETVSLARNSWASIGDLVSGKINLMELSGPVGVGQVVGQAAKMGFKSLLSIAAFISISIGMFNLLPFPALDGGRIVFFIIEAIRRKPISQKYEGYINGAGLILLFGLMIVITCKDIFSLF
ncbi:MAG: M50 family metallopeptidase [Oscillospiraceae bacterium]